MTTGAPHPAGFLRGLPVWPAGRSREMNLTAGFRTTFRASRGDSCTLRITASSAYRAFLNGAFLGCGPARAPHGWFRVDEWDLHGSLREGDNVLAVEVSGYNVNSYYLLDQPAFLQAEVLLGETVVRATGDEGFEAVILPFRLRRVERYSVARTFSEVYRLSPEWERWRMGAPECVKRTACETGEVLRYLPRRWPYPSFTRVEPASISREGLVHRFEPGELRRDWTLTMIGPLMRGYLESELETIPSFDVQRMRSDPAVEFEAIAPGSFGFSLGEGRCRTLDFGSVRAGFIRLRLSCQVRAKVHLVYDELLSGGDVDPFRLRCINIVTLDCEPGAYEFASFEPYTVRYLKLMQVEGASDVHEVSLREYVNPSLADPAVDAADPELLGIVRAASETLRQNTVDLFMDCPSRERAGWLCDSFFIARSVYEATGSAALEQAHLENYLLPRRFAHLPPGMVPMCYPADHDLGNFIPNFALWFILQLDEYERRSGDAAMIEEFRPRVEGIIGYVGAFECREGFLENLESWVFVEWSKANEYVSGVNYPTNMLYSAALAAAGRLYGDRQYVARAERLRVAVRRASFDGTFFVDNAVREKGVLRRTENITEICQYYAFMFGIATRATHPELWSRLVEHFGPGRDSSSTFSGIAQANALNGYLLRLELLSRAGLYRQVVEEAKMLYGPMAARTGTLWEHAAPTASLSHGFQSYAGCLLRRALKELGWASG